MARSGSPESAGGCHGPGDAELVTYLGAGDGAALAELYRRYGKPAYSLARRICVDDGIAEDVVQEVFLALWRDPSRFDAKRGTFATWLFTLIHHKAVDAVRREATIRKRTVPASATGDDWSGPSLPGADQAALSQLAAAQVRKLLARLPEDQRQALALAYYGGHTQREVAAILGIPLGTVKSRMFSGVGRLRTWIAAEGGSPQIAEGGL